MSVADRLGEAPRLAALGVLMVVLGTSGAAADEPGILGRLFRRPAPKPAPPASRPAGDTGRAALGNGHAPAAPSLLPPDTGAPALPGNGTGSMPTPGPATPEVADAGDAPRLRPQPRVSRAATEAEPILTRVALGRSDDGTQFGMFLQIYADGTVIDGEGVHRVGADALRPVLQVLQSTDLDRLRGHCGSPPTDFIEQVYVTVYERKYGGLRANTFSYSGNPKGCEPAVAQLHAALEGLVTRLHSPSSAPATATATAPAAVPEIPPLGAPAPPVLNLTPVN